MNISRKDRHGAEVPTHSLNDIMFFLLLFFLIIATLVIPTVIKMTMPSASAQHSDTKPKSYELVVTENKEYFYNNKQLQLEDLEKVLVADRNSDAEMLLAINLDENLSVQDLVDVMSMCADYQIKTYLKQKKS